MNFAAAPCPENIVAAPFATPHTSCIVPSARLPAAAAQLPLWRNTILSADSSCDCLVCLLDRNQCARCQGSAPFQTPASSCCAASRSRNCRGGVCRYASESLRGGVRWVGRCRSRRFARVSDPSQVRAPTPPNKRSKSQRFSKLVRSHMLYKVVIVLNTDVLVLWHPGTVRMRGRTEMHAAVKRIITYLILTTHASCWECRRHRKATRLKLAGRREVVSEGRRCAHELVEMEALVRATRSQLPNSARSRVAIGAGRGNPDLTWQRERVHRPTFLRASPAAIRKHSVPHGLFEPIRPPSPHGVHIEWAPPYRKLR